MYKYLLRTVEKHRLYEMSWDVKERERARVREKERTRAQRERERERDVNSSLKIINKKENEQKTRQAWWLKINKEYDRDS